MSIYKILAVTCFLLLILSGTLSAQDQTPTPSPICVWGTTTLTVAKQDDSFRMFVSFEASLTSGFISIKSGTPEWGVQIEVVTEACNLPLRLRIRVAGLKGGGKPLFS